MVKILLIFLLLLTKVAFSQINETFSDGNFTQNPVWNGNVSDFVVNNLNQLQSNGPAVPSQTISLSTANENALNTSWTFYLKLNFDPTTTNFVRIYLISDQQDLKATLNGYFVQVGETGSADGFHLYRQNGNTTTKIISGAAKNRASANVVTAKIKVTRDASGKWELLTDVSGGSNFSLEGSVVDQVFANSSHTGVFCKYATASRSNQYIFDDFVIEDLAPDIISPTIKSAVVADGKNIDVSFSEPLNQNSAILASNYVLSNGYNHPISVVSLGANNTYRLTYANDLTSSNYSLSIENVADVKGNVILTNSKIDFFYIKPYVIKKGDVVFNEIFANPSGSPSLPQKEFLELWNTTGEYLLTNGWKYSDQTTSYTFGVDTIKPNQFFILCAKADTSLFKPYGKTIGISPWPTLNNDRDILKLQNQNGETVDQVVYTDTWYKQEIKKKGGFSLELIDPKNICKGIQNWAATNDERGGSPGKINSIYKIQNTTDLPKILSSSIIDSVTIEVVFSKSIDSLSASINTNYFINNGIGNPVLVLPQPALFSTVLIKFSNQLLSGVENTLKIEDVTDCAGNLIDANANTAKFFIAKKPLANELLISEVLFNPKAKGVDFVEIYNNSKQVFDLKDLQLANADEMGNVANRKKISNTSVYILPETYWVLSSNSDLVKESYYTENPNQMVQMASLPTFNNDKGSVILVSNTQVIDRLNYSAKLHHPLIQNEDGISIERISFSVGTNDPSNFKTAAASVGFATPTYKNSQEMSGADSYAQLLSKTFSPDGDNFEDILTLEYQMPTTGNLASLNIYSDKGRLIRKLLKNQTIATKGSLNWDGLDDNGAKAAVGIYVLTFDIFDLNGNTKRFKNTCVLAAKLN